jgi:hypothetical protein
MSLEMDMVYFLPKEMSKNVVNNVESWYTYSTRVVQGVCILDYPKDRSSPTSSLKVVQQRKKRVPRGG